MRSDIVTHVTFAEGGCWIELKYPYSLAYILSLPIIHRHSLCYRWKTFGGLFHAVATADAVYDAVNGRRK